MFSMYLFFITQLDSSLTVSLSEDGFVLIDLTCSKTVNSLILNLNSELFGLDLHPVIKAR